jgi:hypothetical protein
MKNIYINLINKCYKHIDLLAKIVLISFFAIINILLWTIFLFFNDVGAVILIVYYGSALVPTFFVTKYHVLGRLHKGIYQNTKNPFKIIGMYITSFSIMIKYCLFYFFIGIFSLKDSYKNYQEKKLELDKSSTK